MTIETLLREILLRDDPIDSVRIVIIRGHNSVITTEIHMGWRLIALNTYYQKLQITGPESSSVRTFNFAFVRHNECNSAKSTK